MNSEEMKFNWWYRNVSRYLTRKEALTMGRELLDEMCRFLDRREYNINRALLLRNRCWMLCFPFLHKQLGELIEIKNAEGYITPRTTVQNMEQRVKILLDDFNKEAAAA